MKVYKLIYSIKKNQDELKIFYHNFVKRYKSLFKIVYNGKIYSLKSKFRIEDKTLKKIKIKLIAFDYLPSKEYIFFGCNSLIKIDEIKINKTINKEFKDIILSTYKIVKMIYKINLKEENKNIKILGKNFVKKNKEKCKIIYNNEILPLKEHIPIEELIKRKKNKLELYLLEFEIIEDKSYMFHECNLLENISFLNKNILNTETNDILNPKKSHDDFNSNNNTINNEKENSLLKNNESYKENEINLINKFKIMDKNISLENIFLSEISSFEPDEPSFSISKPFEESKLSKELYISINEIENIFNFSYSFSEYYENKKENITGISHMFDGCSSLIFLPDISNWNTEKIKDMSFLFNE